MKSSERNRLNSSIPNYWLVEARNSDGLDQTGTFMKCSFWKCSEASQVKLIGEMKKGDRIAIKRCSTIDGSRILGLPKTRIPMMCIMAIGTITSSSKDGASVSVDWTKLKRPKRWYLYTSDSEIWKLASLDWCSESLIAFAFKKQRQDIKKHKAEYDRRQAARLADFRDWHLALPSSLSDSFDVSLGSDWRIKYASRIGGDISKMLNLYLDSWSFDFAENRPILDQEDEQDVQKYAGLEKRDVFRFSGFELYADLDKFLDSLTRMARLLRSATTAQPRKKLNDVELEQLALFETLTEAECVVLEYWCKGWKDEDIANAIGVAASTVTKDYAGGIRGKLLVDSKLKAVLLAIKLGRIDP